MLSQRLGDFFDVEDFGHRIENLAVHHAFTVQRVVLARFHDSC